MIVTLINPPIIDRKYNVTYSVNLPLGLAYIASYLLKQKINVEVIDAVGEGLNQRRSYKKDYSILGLSNSRIIERINNKSGLIAISVNYSPQHNLAIELIKDIKKKTKNIPLAIGGVHASFHYKKFLEAGADYVVLGEGELSFYNLCLFLQDKIEHKQLKGIIGKGINSPVLMAPFIANIDEIPFPARHLFPMDNYYKERSAQAPANKKFTSVFSSRGCPYNCSYCSSTVFWQRKWRPRSPKNIVDEIKQCVEKFGITEFHFVDDHLTLDKKRIIDFCNEIIKRKLRVNWSAPTGIRPEKVDYELLALMKKSGCIHLTLAPESGSERVLTEIYNKKLNLEKILEIIYNCNKLKITTAGFIIIGAIGETAKDRLLTKKYVKHLAKEGLDEIGVFPLIPYPECPITQKYAHIKEIRNFEELITGIVPKWYPEYKLVKQFKKELYIIFFFYQFFYHPLKILRLIKNFILGKQDTKSDRVVKNMVKVFVRAFNI